VFNPICIIKNIRNDPKKANEIRKIATIIFFFEGVRVLDFKIRFLSLETSLGLLFSFSLFFSIAKINQKFNLNFTLKSLNDE